MQWLRSRAVTADNCRDQKGEISDSSRNREISPRAQISPGRDLPFEGGIWMAPKYRARQIPPFWSLQLSAVRCHDLTQRNGHSCVFLAEAAACSASGGAHTRQRSNLCGAFDGACTVLLRAQISLTHGWTVGDRSAQYVALDIRGSAGDAGHNTSNKDI